MEPMEIDNNEIDNNNKIDNNDIISMDIDDNNDNNITKKIIKSSKNICNICRDNIEQIDKIIILKKCKHIYCEDCLKLWAKHNKNTYNKYITCMYCKKNSPLLDKKKDEEYIKNYHSNKYIDNIILCKGLKKNGDECINKAKKGKEYCGVHIKIYEST